MASEYYLSLIGVLLSFGYPSVIFRLSFGYPTVLSRYGRLYVDALIRLRVVERVESFGFSVEKTPLSPLREGDE